MKHEAIMDNRYSLLWAHEIPLWQKRRAEHLARMKETFLGRVILWLRGKL